MELNRDGHEQVLDHELLASKTDSFAPNPKIFLIRTENTCTLGRYFNEGTRMAQIPWSRIREAFDGEWIELVHYSWKPESLHPHAGRIRHHSPNRRELLKMIARSGRIEGSVVLFVGPSLPAVLAEQSFTGHASGLA
jgi:hypothetical protein